MRWRRILLIAPFVLASLAFAPMLVADAAGALPSACHGATNGGWVRGATRPPIRGGNFRTYCLLCVLALRTYGHAPAVDAMLDGYAELARTRPRTTYVYGEIGHPWGRRFPPHRTHRNGLSFDFMVPLTEGTLPTTWRNRFGYDAAYGSDGRGDGGRIDFAALADHLVALDRAARERSGSIALVVLAPDLQDAVRAAANGALDDMRFNRRPSWVRHDDHYHVDFAFACE